MPKMTLHFINARRQLDDLKDWLSERLYHAFNASAERLTLGDIDVIVRAGTYVIPEKGHVGYAPENSVIYVTIDPGSPTLSANRDYSLERMLAHELHHCSRWDGPGYGKTLGESLVSEGLAGHFVQEVFGGQPEPWESLPLTTAHSYVSEAQAKWADIQYGHAEWFFGSGKFPRWLGYSLGYQVIKQYLNAHIEAKPSKLAWVEAENFRRYLYEFH